MALQTFGGTPEQKSIDRKVFLGDVKSYVGATVNSFKGQTMKREFEYANELKPNENDNVDVIQGKLEALKSLHDISEQKK